MKKSATPTTIDALLKSILNCPLLVGDLPESKCFCRSNLSRPEDLPNLNLRQKLGHLFEDALAALLAASDRMELLEQNLQLRDEDLKTVGELDFLLKDYATPTLIHLELATKFYLAVETPEGFALPGPDARDNYFRKLSRLRDHQLKLPMKFRSCLPSEYQSEPIATRHLIYGCLFDHVDASQAYTPEFVLDNCRRGKWIHEHDCERHFGSDSKFELIPKALWPVPLELLKGVTLQVWTPQGSIDRCVMVRANQDLTPYFIAPTNYPIQKHNRDATISKRDWLT